ncbi:hypothetical protein BT96DRAFT_1015353 [Gymnopus androsaceus JB14]|uniref:Calcium-dependent phosphotriesterase n=1 Tax=Gymnopus androsaceus JB14 TaxID=1447944 RepID=A0A6A4I5S9_9AGAR|nr:hypothetical protein BT96DRAFT_1015353 [Gymnopus androsaceus JB14]
MRLSFLASLILSTALGGLRAAASDRTKMSSSITSTPSISLENLAVRHTGEIIVGFRQWPDPLPNRTKSYIDIHGIVEVAQDQFYVTCGNLSLVTHIDVPGSPSVFHVNMTGFPEHLEVNEVAHFPEARILNGMTLLSEEKGLVYIADSRVGVVNLLNVYTGEFFVAINNSLTNQPPGADEISNCVHGVHVPKSNKYLYFSNFAQGIIARVLIHPDTGLAAGEPEIIKSNLTTVEDFVLDKDLNIFTALFVTNEFVRVDGKTGEVLVLAGNENSTEYKWAASVRFGRLASDKGDLYATINGGFLEPDNVGGALFRIDLGELAVV